jgi:hypothetical protein
MRTFLHGAEDVPRPTTRGALIRHVTHYKKSELEKTMRDFEFSEKVFDEAKFTRYHEAGHAVADYVLGFKPRLIDDALEQHDRRTTAFLRVNHGLLSTPRTRQRAADYAVALIAGPAAQAKVSGRNLCDLRLESDRVDEGDYRKVYLLLDRLALCGPYEFNASVRDAHLHLFEQQAIALINEPRVWAAVESVATELEMTDGYLERAELISAIKNGLLDTRYMLTWSQLMKRVSGVTVDAVPADVPVGEIDGPMISA